MSVPYLDADNHVLYYVRYDLFTDYVYERKTMEDEWHCVNHEKGDEFMSNANYMI